MAGQNSLRFAFDALGTECSFQLYEERPGEAVQAAEAARNEILRIEKTYSRYRPDNLVHCINKAGALGGSIELDAETSDLIDLAFAAHERSGGLFDLTSGVFRAIWNDDLTRIPEIAELASLASRAGLHLVNWQRPNLKFLVTGMEIDFGGLGKEYAADRAAQICREFHIQHGLIDLGGDLVVLGPHPDGSAWRVGIRSPVDPDAAMATLLITHGALATSGNYARRWELEGRYFGHIINPRTGWPVEGLSSVTVWKETCIDAGLTSTIAMLMGNEGEQWLCSTDTEFLVIDQSNDMRGSIPIDARKFSDAG